MAIKMRTGKESELDISKAIPGEWLVSTDTRYVRMCFAPGIVLRMATYDAFEADMAQIQSILEEAKTVEEAIQKIYDDVQQVVIDIETASNAAQIAIQKSEESEYFANAAASSASAAKTSETNASSSASSASTSASTATQKAKDASTYANNAKNSANTANTHATTASSKATEASTSANTASIKANAASDSALLAESYSVGGTGTRENEDVDNAEYYYEQAKRISQGMNGLIPMGTITFADLSNPDNQQPKYMFNISDEFVTDETFKGGAGYYYGAGTNVFRTDDGFWDAFAPSSVSGVKGENESTYRQGLVEITADDIGLGNVDNTSDADKPISNATQTAFDEVNERIDESVSDLQSQIDTANSNLDILSQIQTIDNVELYSNWCSANVLGGKEVVLNLLVSKIALLASEIKEILTIPTQYAPKTNIRLSAVFVGTSGQDAGYGNIDILVDGTIKINCIKFITQINWAHVNVTYLLK